MNEPDLNNLRGLLGEYEQYAESIAAVSGRSDLVDRMRSAIAEARRALLPSEDGTANYVDSKAIVERLDALRREAESGQSRYAG